MDLFLVQVDGLDVAITDSKAAAREHAERLAREEPVTQVQVVRIVEGSLVILPGIPAAEAVTAVDLDFDLDFDLDL
jgi:hypothetical protein